MRRSKVIRSTIVVTHENGAPMKTELCYNPNDPYALTMAFQTSSGWVEWTLARDLLADGMVCAAGEGDMRIRPHGDGLEFTTIELRSPGPVPPTMVNASADELGAFLERTYDVVPPDTESEWMDFDEALAGLVPPDVD